MYELPTKTFAVAEKKYPVKRPVHFVWVEPEDTPAQMQEKKNQVIADGHAKPADVFHYIRWKGPNDPD